MVGDLCADDSDGIDKRAVVAPAMAVVSLWLLVKPDTSMNLGDLMTIGCAVAFARHMICLERFARQVDAPSLLLWQMVAMTVLFLPARGGKRRHGVPFRRRASYGLVLASRAS
ncbi:MAG: hypothetical protein ACXWWJ_00425 [Nitrospira sp.]